MPKEVDFEWAIEASDEFLRKARRVGRTSTVIGLMAAGETSWAIGDFLSTRDPAVLLMGIISGIVAVKSLRLRQQNIEKFEKAIGF